MRISDWSSDVCSSDLAAEASHGDLGLVQANCAVLILSNSGETSELSDLIHYCQVHGISTIALTANPNSTLACRSEEHTSELQSLMRISYAVFCLKKKKTNKNKK